MGQKLNSTALERKLRKNLTPGFNPTVFHMFWISSSLRNNQVGGRRASPVFHPSRGRPSARPPGILGDRWGSLTCEGAAELHLQRRELTRVCFPCEGADVLADCTDRWWSLSQLAFFNRKTTRESGQPPDAAAGPSPPWLLSRVNLSRKFGFYEKKCCFDDKLLEEEDLKVFS